MYAQTTRHTAVHYGHRLARTLSLLLVLLCVCGASAVAAATTTTVAVPATYTLTESQLLVIDLGSSSTKAAALRTHMHVSGAGGGATPSYVTTASVDLLLNDQSNRKSPSCVAFRTTHADDVAAAMRDNNNNNNSSSSSDDRHLWSLERSFAEQALALQVRYPTHVVCNPMRLLAATTTTTATTAAATSPLYATTALPHRHNVTAMRLPHSGDNVDDVRFTGEELTAMLLSYVARMARHADRDDNRIAAAAAVQHHVYNNSSNSSNNNNTTADDDDDDDVHDTAVRHAVVAIPSSASLAQRQALLDAGALAGLRVVRLLHDTTAAAVQLAHLYTPQLFARRTTATTATTATTTTSDNNSSSTVPAAVASDNNSNNNTIVSTGSAVQYVMLYDMGSRHTEAAVFAYYTVAATSTETAAAAADRADADTNMDSTAAAAATAAASTTHARRPRRRRYVVELVARASNASLGGDTFDACLASYWDVQHLHGCTWSSWSQHDNNNNNDNDKRSKTTAARQREQTRRQARLLRAAAQAREMLSVNSDIPVIVEGVVLPSSNNSSNNNNNTTSMCDDSSEAAATTLTTRLSRAVFADVCAAHFDAAIRVRDAALAAAGAALASRNSSNNNKSSNMTAPSPPPPLALSALSRLEVIGGATRMPHLLARLGMSTTTTAHNNNNNNDKATTTTTTTSLPVGRTLNADEAVVLGAAHVAATRRRAAHATTPLVSFHVRDELTHDIAVMLSPPAQHHDDSNNNNSSSSSASLPQWTLFTAHHTRVPAYKSLQLPNRTSDFTLTLYSPASHSDDDEDVTRPRYVQHNRIVGVVQARQRAVAAATTANVTDNNNNNNDNNSSIVTRQRTLVQTTVVVDVAVSESGLPFVHKAQLVATYDDVLVTHTRHTRAADSNNSSETTPAGDGGNNTSNVTHDDNATTTTTTTRSPPQRVTLVWPLGIVRAHEDDDAAATEHAATTTATTHMTWLRSANVRRREARQLQRRLRVLERVEQLRMQRSVLRNDVEVLVLALKASSDAALPVDGDNNNNNNNNKDGNNTTTRDEWRQVLQRADAWLDGYTADADVSNAQLTRWRTQLRRARAQQQQQQGEQHA